MHRPCGPPTIPQPGASFPPPAPGGCSLPASAVLGSAPIPCLPLAALRCASLGDTTRCVGLFAPNGPERTTVGQGLVFRYPQPDHARGEVQGVPSSWGILVCLCPVLRPRSDRTLLAQAERRCCPRDVQDEGSGGYSSRGSIARPWHWLSTLRPVGYPHQDARLASGCWLGFAGWDW
jgi:hypothetical protein